MLLIKQGYSGNYGDQCCQAFIRSPYIPHEVSERLARATGDVILELRPLPHLPTQHAYELHTSHEDI